MKEAHDRIKYKLLEHGIALSFVDRIEGLSVDLYRFEPTVGVKMTTIEKYQKDIEQILGVSGVRILAPIPNTEYVGFEVPRKKRVFVSIEKAKKAKDLGEILFGLDVYGVAHTVDIREMPHLLVAGTTGSGKSIFMHSLLLQLSRLPKNLVQFVLFDPKMVELQDFATEAHTLTYRDAPDDILASLVSLIGEMNKRFALFKKHKVRNLAQYREKIGKDLPYLVVVVDEFGDLIIGGHGASIKGAMIALAQKARAAGIHLIITTQRPSAKIVDGLIKANFPCRVAFKTASRVDSEIIIDRLGAEMLLGKGDMLLCAGGAPERLQGFLTA
jgi:S-DNA-T family DNA segregation ATPase FtsK/SpoIIIE